MYKKVVLIGFYIISLFILFNQLGFINPIEARSYRSSPSDVYVRGYFRRDGTYVQPHYRSSPDGIIWNNYSCIDDGKCGSGYSYGSGIATIPTQGSYKVCDRGFKKNYSTGNCEQIKVPEHGKLNYFGNDWECEDGYKKNYSTNSCNKVNIPENAKLISGSYWSCNKGYKRNYSNDTCELIKIPEHGKLNYFGNDWTCESGYKRNYQTNQCDKVICPPNSYESYGYCFCNSGFMKDHRTGQCNPR